MFPSPSTAVGKQKLKDGRLCAAGGLRTCVGSPQPPRLPRNVGLSLPEPLRPRPPGQLLLPLGTKVFGSLEEGKGLKP